MNRNIIIGVAVLVAAAVVIGIIVGSGKSSKTPVNGTPSQQASTNGGQNSSTQKPVSGWQAPKIAEAPALTVPEGMPGFPTPAWFTDGHGAGLERGPDGGLLLGGEPLQFENPPGELFAAAFYGVEGQLVTVDNEGNANLYTENGTGVLTQQAARMAGFKARTQAVRFTRIPGVLYLLSVNMGRDPQGTAGHYRRVGFDAETKHWQGFSVTSDQGEQLLMGVYRVITGGLAISTGAATEWIGLPMPDVVGEPFQSKPLDPLAEVVFHFPGKGTVVRTARGWSLHAPDGSRWKWFTDIDVKGADRWENPTFDKNAGFQVHASTGQGKSTTYNLDTESGRLEKAGK